MRTRLTKLTAALAAVAALAVGGSALATAGGKKAQATPPAAAQVQQGIKSAKDNPVEPAENSAEAQSGTDTDNVQQGDQSAADNPAEAQSEQSGSESETDASDGPGGYADSNAGADTQQQGQN